MIKKILICITAFIVLSTKAQVVPNVDWVKYYSQKGSINNSPTDLDINNNVYITGYVDMPGSIVGMKTLKYDSLGNSIFNATYSNGTYDVGNAIKVSSIGKVYVAGITYSSSTNNDGLVVKYNSNGSLVWASKFNGAANGIDEFYDLKLDGSNNVYVTGKTMNTSGNFDIVTQKYNTSGTLMWSHSFNGTANSNDEGVALVLSSNGSTVYVTGSTTNSTSTSDIVTYALTSSSGSLVWNTITNGTANLNDKPAAIVLVGHSIPVVCGYINNSTSGNDYVTIGYKPNGVIALQKAYDFGNADNRATALVKDAIGNMVITGTAKNGTLTEIHTVFYDTLGTQVWVNKEITGLASLSANPKIVTDTIANHFYVSGQIMKTTEDVYVYQIAPTGNTTWKQTWDGTAAGTDAATDLSVNGIGVIYLSAQCKNSSAKYDITAIKISQTPVYFPIDFGMQELNDKGFVFQENKGQLLTPTGSVVSNTVVEYYNQSSTPSYYFNKSRISAVIANSNTLTNLPDSLVRVDMNFLYTNQLTQIYKYNKTTDTKHYFTTSNPNGITEVGSYERLFVPNIYSNIDVHHYSNTKGLKTYFVCKIAETFPKPIINISGAITTSINGNGELIATTNLGTINYGKLTAYQATVNPTTLTYTILPVASAAWNSLGSNNYGFSVTGYNSAYPLVIYFSRQGATSSSAVSNINNMYWSTFVGGQGSDRWMQSKIDAKDNYYTVGNSAGINFPTTPGAYQNLAPTSAAGMQYGIMSKFDKDGAIKYSTYFGGSNPYDICGNPSITQIQDVAIDSTYNIYLVGRTTSTSMPTKTISLSGALNYTANAANTNISGGCTNGFIAKIQAPGNALWYSSYFGGSKLEVFTSVKYMNGQIFMGGISSSTSIPLNSPLPNTYQISSGGGMYMHLDTAGAVKHITKLQAPVRAGDADKNGNYYLVSDGSLATVPIIAPAASFYTATAASVAADWGIQRFSIADSLTWSTNYGGTGIDYPYGICIRDSVMAIVGRCDGNFPIVKSATDSGDVAHANDFDISLVKFNIKTGQRLWSVLHATGNNDNTYGCVLDKNYNLYVTGSVKCGTTNTIFPNCPANNFKNVAISGYYNQPNKIDYDAFLLGYNNKNQRKWTTNFGSLSATGNGGSFNYDAAYCIAVNSQSKLFIAGETNSKNNSLPLVRWNSVCYYDSVCADVYPSAAYDAFITMFDVTNFVVGIKENSKTVELTSNIILYPNPNNGIFTLQFKEQPSGKLNLNIINILGQQVYELNNFRPETSELRIDLENLTRGVYFITVSENNKPHTIKFIVQ